MSNDDFRRDLNRAFDDVAGAPSSNLPDRVRRAVHEAPGAARPPYWIAGVAAGVIAVLLVGVLYVANPLNRPSPSHGGVVPTPAASASPSPPTVVQSVEPAQPFGCTTVAIQTASQGATAGGNYAITALRTGTHAPGYDRLTIEFAGGVPTPIEIRPQTGTSFTLSPSGMQTTLKGQGGILIIIHGSDLHSSYSGRTDIVTGYHGLAEVKRIEDFEGVVQIALGVNGQGCFRDTLMTNPYRLVIDVPSS